MKVGDTVALTEDNNTVTTGEVISITILIDSDGELFEIPVEEALIPEFEKTNKDI